MAILGILSDTHGLLRPEALELLSGVDLIIHAGDIGAQKVIDQLADIAPVLAIRGNVDKGEWSEAYPDDRHVEVEGKQIYVLHNRRDLNFNPESKGLDVVISGHSHKPLIETIDGVLYVNPGSAGPRRFTLPIALAKLEIVGDSVAAQIIEIRI